MSKFDFRTISDRIRNCHPAPVVPPRSAFFRLGWCGNYRLGQSTESEAAGAAAGFIHLLYIVLIGFMVSSFLRGYERDKY